MACESERVHFLVGANGSGKTTLLRCITRTLSFQGDILLDGTSIRLLSPAQLARAIALVPQQLVAHPQLSVYEYVLMGRFPYLNWLGTYTGEDHRQANVSIDRMGLTALRDRMLSQLSGGEIQKASIARALCQQSELLLLDEPGQSLDPLARKDLVNLLLSLGREERKTILCITHDLEALRRPDVYIWGIKEGRLVWKSKGMDAEERLLEKVYIKSV